MSNDQNHNSNKTVIDVFSVHCHLWSGIHDVNLKSEIRKSVKLCAVKLPKKKKSS